MEATSTPVKSVPTRTIEPALRRGENLLSKPELDEPGSGETTCTPGAVCDWNLGQSTKGYPIRSWGLLPNGTGEIDMDEGRGTGVTVQVGSDTYAVTEGQEFTFGRSPNCSVCLDPPDAAISRQAGMIRSDSGNWFVLNLSSADGESERRWR
jgi:hypothetical protein